MRREIAIALLCGGLGACQMPSIGGPGPSPVAYAPPVLGSDLPSARTACNQAYPPRIGNYLPHAGCVNAAVERYAVPAARYPDLLRLQEQARAQISSRIDSRAISARAGEQQMSEADRAIDAAEHERNAEHQLAANQQIARVEAILR